MNTPETNRPRAAAAVWEHSRQTGARLLTMLALADLADDTGTVRVRVETLANQCRTNPTHALVLLCELVASGELAVTYQGTGPSALECAVCRITLIDGPAPSASPRKP